MWGPEKVRSPFPLKIIFPVGCGVSKIAILYKPPPLTAWERLALDEPWAYKPPPAKEVIYDVVSVTSPTTITIGQRTGGTMTTALITLTTSIAHGLTGFNTNLPIDSSTGSWGNGGGGPSTGNPFGNMPPLRLQAEGPYPRNRREQRILRALGPWRVSVFVRMVNLFRERDRLLGARSRDWNSIFWSIVTHDLTETTRWDKVRPCTQSQRVPFRRRMRRKHLPSSAG